MDRKFEYLAALARERHFARAAAACGVSQPTLSAAIRQLEKEYGVPIVERGRTFHGLTAEGQAVLTHARAALAAEAELRNELAARRGQMAGRLRLGVIPTALTAVADAIAPFSARHPAVTLEVLSLSSREIERRLADYEIDAGITYLDNEPLTGVRRRALFTERYFLLTRRTEPAARRASIAWAEAAALPLCLLTPDMQNRRIVDAAFAAAGAALSPAMETNSIVNLVATVRHGPWSSVAPGQLIDALATDRLLVAVPLVQPEVKHRVGVVTADRPAPLRLVSAFLAALPRRLNR